MYLELVNERTFKRVLNMKLPQEQACFVASNAVSLAQAWLYSEEARPYALCEGDEVVGFMMLDWDEAEKTCGIWRLMIAPEHQKKGYGRQAVEAAVTLAREAGCMELVHLSVEPENTVAKRLYRALGFEETGEIDAGEEVMVLRLDKQQG